MVVGKPANLRAPTHTHRGYIGSSLATFYYVNYWTVVRVGIPRGREKVDIEKDYVLFSQELFSSIVLR